METLRNISIAWSLLHVLVIFSFLFESRYSRKKTTILILACMGPLLIINFVLYILLGPEKMAHILLLACTIPSLIFFFIIAKHRNSRFFFTFCLADTVSYEIITMTMLIDYYLAGNQYIFMLISRLIIFPVLELLILKYLRRRYLAMQQTIKKGWLAFAVVSAVFYVLLIVMTSIPTIITTRPDDLLSLILVLVVMPLMYINIFQILFRQQKLYQAEEESRILRIQTSMLAQRMDHIKKLEEQMRIIRHDWRHKLRTTVKLMENGHTEDAIDYLTKEVQSLNQNSTTSWCQNPVLDAVFSVYFRLAESNGIRVETSLDISKHLPVDATELSTVFSNALENAIHACMKLPEEQRWLRCKCLCSPQFMFKISNPYSGTVNFNHNGLPMSSHPSHGIGTRSISAFCEKYNAHCEYKTEKGVFTLYMLIQQPSTATLQSTKHSLQE